MGREGTPSQDGLGSGQVTAGAGDAEAVGDQVVNGRLRPRQRRSAAAVQRDVAVELIEVAGQVAATGIDGPAPGG